MTRLTHDAESELVSELRRVAEWLRSWDPDEGRIHVAAANRIEALEARAERAENGWDECSANRHRLLLEVKELDARVTELEAENAGLRDVVQIRAGHVLDLERALAAEGGDGP